MVAIALDSITTKTIQVIKYRSYIKLHRKINNYLSHICNNQVITN
jgi:hypothetical protein